MPLAPHLLDHLARFGRGLIAALRDPFNLRDALINQVQGTVEATTTHSTAMCSTALGGPIWSGRADDAAQLERLSLTMTRGSRGAK
jgi:hypothetical protein